MRRGILGEEEETRVLLGSVSQAVALHAKCSVEIVRRLQTQTGKSAKCVAIDAAIGIAGFAAYDPLPDSGQIE
jgi:hypothetical protein